MISLAISDNKYSTNHHSLLKPIPQGKMYSTQISRNYCDVMSYHTSHPTPNQIATYLVIIQTLQAIKAFACP